MKKNQANCNFLLTFEGSAARPLKGLTRQGYFLGLYGFCGHSEKYGLQMQ